MFIISLTGNSGAGKTTIVSNLIDAIGANNVSHLQQDSYYKDQSQIPLKERNNVNYDHPDTFDIDLFVLDLKKLSKGIIIDAPIYNFSTHTRESSTERIIPKKLILAEGIHMFYTEELRGLVDLKVFVDVPIDICFIRRLLRDRKDRDRSVESIVSQYLETVRPMQEKYISPSIKYADLVIENGTDSDKKIKYLTNLIFDNIS